MRRFDEGALAPVDKGGTHAERFGTDAIERMACNKQAACALLADQRRCRGVGFPMWLKVASLLDGNHMIEREVDMRFGCFQHIAIAVGEDGELEAAFAQALESLNNFGKRL